jgi:hypothetical protein
MLRLEKDGYCTIMRAMLNDYGVVKISPAGEMEKPPLIRDVDAAVEILRRFGAALHGNRSGSTDWPKITKCIQRHTTVAIDARGSGIEASILFGTGACAPEHTYLLKHATPQKVETGSVEHVEALSDSLIREPQWMGSPAYALAAYPYRFVVFTSADNRARTGRAWLIGISEFSETAGSNFNI